MASNTKKTVGTVGSLKYFSDENTSILSKNV